MRARLTEKFIPMRSLCQMLQISRSDSKFPSEESGTSGLLLPLIVKSRPPSEETCRSSLHMRLSHSTSSIPSHRMKQEHSGVLLCCLVKGHHPRGHRNEISRSLMVSRWLHFNQMNGQVKIQTLSPHSETSDSLAKLQESLRIFQDC